MVSRNKHNFLYFCAVFLHINEFVAGNAQTQISRLKIIIFNLSCSNIMSKRTEIKDDKTEGEDNACDTSDDQTGLGPL